MKKDGRFKKGHIPYNKGKERGSVSPQTEFKKGIHSITFKGYGVPSIRDDGIKRPEVYTTTKEKIESITRGKKYMSRKRTTMARYLWKEQYGNIPKGMIVYNDNQKDPINIKIKNLRLITRAELLELNNINRRGK